MMTAVCRHIIGGPVPLALFDATTQGTGKTLLAEVIALILTGRAAELMSPPAAPEEWRKQLTSILIEAPPLVVIDNVASVVDWPCFCKVITGEMHRDRLLGKSQTVSVPVRCSWIITGNNLQLAGDMVRRCYWIRMDAGCSDPFRRTGFKHERLKEYVLAHRRELLIALLTIARAWFAAGQPKASTPPVGSFERWTEVIAGILQHAQVDGFLTNSDRLFEQSDVERSDWETFVEAIEDAFPEAERLVLGSIMLNGDQYPDVANVFDASKAQGVLEIREQIPSASHARERDSSRKKKVRQARARDFDEDPWMLNTASGTVDLRTGTLRPHRPVKAAQLEPPFFPYGGET